MQGPGTRPVPALPLNRAHRLILGSRVSPVPEAGQEGRPWAAERGKRGPSHPPTCLRGHSGSRSMVPPGLSLAPREANRKAPGECAKVLGSPAPREGPSGPPTRKQHPRSGRRPVKCSSCLSQAPAAPREPPRHQRRGKTRSGLHVPWSKVTTEGHCPRTLGNRSFVVQTGGQANTRLIRETQGQASRRGQRPGQERSGWRARTGFAH